MATEWRGRAPAGPQEDVPEEKKARFAVPAKAIAAAPVTLAGDAADGTWRQNVRGEDAALGYPRPHSWWTGLQPSEALGTGKDGRVTSLPLPDLATSSRQSVLDYFDNSWMLTEVLFSALQGEEAFYRPPYHALRHPLIFYYAHPAALYVNKLRVAGVLAEGVNDYFETIFETGVDEMSWDDLSKNDMRWPAVSEVTAYRRTVYGLVRGIIQSHDCLARFPVTMADPAWALFMGFEHERIHLETSSVLMRELPLRLLRKPDQWPAYHPDMRLDDPAEGSALGIDRDRDDAQQGADHQGATNAPQNALLEVAAQSVTVGKPAAFPSFGWDNEYGSRTLQVAAFRAARFLVSNGEFLEFVKDGGYADPKLWEEAGWRWRTFRNAKWPCFWVPDGPFGLHRYALRLVFEVVPFQPTLPAVVNYHEAKAYCNWRTRREGLDARAERYRVMTEAEHHCIREPVPLTPEGLLACDPTMRATGRELQAALNLSLAYGAETPVHALRPTSAGFHDEMGNVWVWCEDHIAALPGFQVHKYYDDFTTPCFDGEHNVIMGGSFVSTGQLASRYARYHFRPHFFQHAGFRLVRAAVPPAAADGAPIAELTCCDAPPPRVGLRPCCSKGARRASEGESRVLPSSAGAGLLLSVGAQALLHYLVKRGGAPVEALLPAGASVGEQGRVLADAMAAAVARHAGGVPLARALDVGCSVGGVSLALSELCDNVLGVDLSAAYLEVAGAIQSAGTAELGGGAAAAAAGRGRVDRVAFRRMDPMCLAPDLGEFDVVAATLVLSRLSSPKSLLGRLHGPRGLVRVGGLALVCDTFAFSHDVTPGQLFLAPSGAAAAAGGAEPLDQAMGESWQLLETCDLALPVPLTTSANGPARAAALLLPQLTVWRRIK